MTDPVQAALDALADGRDVDWQALGALCPDAATRRRIDRLAEIASIVRAHAAPAHDPAAPETIACWGALQVRQRIGGGVHGDVYRAWDPRLEREVALKLLHRDVEDRPGGFAALSEGRLLARVRHPNVVTIYGADRIDGRAGLWMELVQGRTLRERVITDGPLHAAEAARFGVQLCDGLAAIHVAGLLHRDVKAQNVMLTSDGRAVLTDLGAARDIATRASTVEGTPAYLAPEILEGQPASAASEVYALGVLLYFATTGSYPFPADSLCELRAAHTHGSIRQDPRLPDPYRSVVARALSRDPAARFRSIDELGAALRRVERGRRPLAALVIVAFTAIVASIVVALAAHLAERGHEHQPGVVRTVHMPSFIAGPPSHDGRFYPYIDADGSIAVWEVATVRSRPVVPRPPHATLESPLLSPDGSQIVYTVADEDGGYEVDVANTDGSWPRLLLPRQTAYEPAAVDWSRRGDRLLLWFRQPGSADLVTVRLPGGRPAVLTSIRAPEPPQASFSPDARFVVTVGDHDAGLRVIDVNTRAAVGLAETRGANAPAWLASGGILFLRASPSGRASQDVWVQPMDGTRPLGQPELRNPAIGAPGSAFVSDAGDLYLRMDSPATDIYIEPVDLGSGRATGPPTRVDPDEIGGHVAPAWSPDGNLLAYFTTRPVPIQGAPPVRTLTIRDVRAGTHRSIDAALQTVAGYQPCWAADGRSVIVFGSDAPGIEHAGYYAVDLATGRAAAVVVPAPAPAVAECGANGTFFYLDPKRGIVERRTTGEETIRVPQVAASAGHINRFAVSRDGATITFDTHSPDTHVLFLQRLTGGARRLDIARAPESLRLATWTPDGRDVIYTRSPAHGPMSVWKVAGAGSTPQRLELTVPPAINPMALSPDGRRIAYPERVWTFDLHIVPLAPAPPRAHAR